MNLLYLIRTTFIILAVVGGLIVYFEKEEEGIALFVGIIMFIAGILGTFWAFQG